MRLILFFVVMLTTGVRANSLPAIFRWTGPSDVETFVSTNLFEHINGAAPGYHAYDFEKLWVGFYEKDEKMLGVEIYQHSSPTTAFGIFSAECPRRASFINVGYSGYNYQDMLVFVSGSYYVRLDFFDLIDLTAAERLVLAKKIQKGLGVNSERISGLDLLPMKNQIPHSVRYLNENFLGQPSLKKVFEARYQKGNKKWRLFSILTDSRADSLRMLAEYTQSINVGSPSTEGVKVIDDPYNGKIFVQYKPSGIVGAYGYNLTFDEAKKELSYFSN